MIVNDPKLPLVSVLTPCFNSGLYLERCIQSVLAQDYPRVEHMVQDAGSTDGTLEVLRRSGARVNWVSQPDRGQSDGLNRALQRSSGEIIVVLNADDELLPHAASWAIKELTLDSTVAAVYGDQYCIDSTGSVVSEAIGPHPYDFKRIFCVEDVIPAQTAFIRRRHLEQVGFYADVTRATCPDYEMWVRLGLRFPLRYTPGFVAKYRIHPGSEGRQVPVVVRMIESKREVIERVLNDTAAPPSVVHLRRRAHSGVQYWGALTLATNGASYLATFRFLQAIALFPHSMSRLVQFMKVVRDHSPHPFTRWLLAMILHSGSALAGWLPSGRRSQSTLGHPTRSHYSKHTKLNS